MRPALAALMSAKARSARNTLLLIRGDNMSDLIDRQAAIDAVNEWLKLYVINRTMSNITSIQDILRHLPSAQPDTDEWCHDCKEYDKEHHCCPRWNRVIRTTLEEAQPDKAYEKSRWRR